MRFTTLILVLLLAGCGIKPSKLEPPAGADKNAFPATYPKPAAPAENPK